MCYNNVSAINVLPGDEDNSQGCSRRVFTLTGVLMCVRHFFGRELYCDLMSIVYLYIPITKISSKQLYRSLVGLQLANIF